MHCSIFAFVNVILRLYKLITYYYYIFNLVENTINVTMAAFVFRKSNYICNIISLDDIICSVNSCIGYMAVSKLTEASPTLYYQMKNTFPVQTKINVDSWLGNVCVCYIKRGVFTEWHDIAKYNMIDTRFKNKNGNLLRWHNV